METRESREQKVNALLQMPLGRLEETYRSEKASGALTPGLDRVYKELVRTKASEYVSGLAAMEAADIERDVVSRVASGEISRQFSDSVVKPLWAEKYKQRRERSALQATKDVVGAVVEAGPLNIAADVAKAIYQGGQQLAEASIQATGVAGSDFEDRLTGGAKVAAMLETGARQTGTSLIRFAQAVTPWDSKLDKAFDAGDVDGAWELALGSKEAMRKASRAEGWFAEKVSLSAADLAEFGIELSDEDVADVEQGAEAASELVESFIPARLAFNIAGRGAKLALKNTNTGGTVARFMDRLGQAAGRVDAGTLSRRVETKAQEATRLAEEADRYNSLFKRARVKLGGKTVELGNALRRMAATRGAGSSAGMFAAGAALANGGDVEEALFAGIAGTLGTRLLANPLARRSAGSMLAGTGRALQADWLPTPLANFSKGLTDFRAAYKPFRASLVGAGAGAFGSLPFILGAETDAEAASSLVSGAGIGATAGLGMRVVAWGADSLTKRGAAARGLNSEVQGPVRPAGPSGVDAQADAINGRAENELSQSGLRFVQQQRDFVKQAAGADYFVGQTPADMATLFTRFHKNPGDVSDFNGVFIEAKNSTTGKPVVLVKIGTSASGHEVGHAVMAAAQADPATKPLVDNALKAAAKSMGGEYDPKTGKLKYTSERLEALKEHYERMDPSGQQRAWDDAYFLHENVAEHASVLFSGAPAGKLGGSKDVSTRVSDLLVAFADAITGRRPGLAESGPTTSDVQPYSPSFDLLDKVGEVIRARSLEQSVDVPDASVEVVAPATPSRKVGPTKGRTVDVGTLVPVPVELTSDQALAPVSPPARVAPATTSTGVAQPEEQRSPNPPDAGSTPAAPATPSASASAPAPSAAPSAAPVTPAGAVRGQQTQAARVNVPAPLTEAEKQAVAADQPDAALRPVAEAVIGHVKALGGQRVGIPVAEVSYQDDTTGTVRSKRVAPYAYETSSTGKVTVVAADLDRVNYNAGLLFDWAASVNRSLPYTSVNDPAFIADVQTYLRNQAEGRRGSGEPLMVGGRPSTASGEPVARLSREKEQFLSLIMGQAIPAALTTRSADAIARIRATAEASGVQVRETETGAVEPNALRDQFRQAGAPVDRIGEDPDPARRQANPAGRNSVVMRMRLPNIRSFQLTGQSVSQPNIQAIEASFQPASSPAAPTAPEPVRSRAANQNVKDVSRTYVGQVGLNYRPHEKAVPVKEELAKRIADLYDSAQDSPQLPEVRQAYQALADEVVQQWKAFEAEGYTAEPWTGEGQPYKDSADMMRDVRENKHLYYFRTEDGFGAGITPDMRASNPMLAESGVSFGPEANVPVNDVFRVVHDIVGHGAHGYEFGPKGEFNAYLEHSRMFSDRAKPALAAETLAQNSWVNYGPHLRKPDGTLPKKGEPGYVSPAERRFADQKNIVIPKEILDEVDAYAAQTGGTITQFQPATLDDFRGENVASALNRTGWAIASAENPGAVELSTAENARRTSEFRQELDRQGLEYAEVRGSYGRPENSFIIVDPELTIDRAVALATRLGQESILTKHGLVYQDGSISPARGIQTFDTRPDDFFTEFDGNFFSADIDFDTRIAPDSPEGQTLRAEEALSLAAPAAGDAQFQPASLASERVKGPKVQFKSKAKEGSKGGTLDLVHFSSKELKEIDPKKSFGKGAATPADMQGMPKSFFYVKGTSYEAPIARRSNVYAAQVDGNSLYDYNADALGVRSIVNREARDQAIRDAGFVGYYVETPGFNAVAIFDKIKVEPTLAEEVMNRRQLVDTGRAELTLEDRRAFAAEDRANAQQERAQARELRAREREIRRSPEFKAEARRLVESGEAIRGSFFFDEAMDSWVQERLDQDGGGDAQFQPPEAEVDSYLALPEARNGLYLSSDVARPLIPGYDPKTPGEFQARASAVVDASFERMLQSPEVREVVFTAGGPGSGKSTAVAALNLDDAGSLVFDSVMGTEASAARDVQKALDAGKPVTVAFVYRPFEASVQGVISRTQRENRTVPVSRIASSHLNSMRTFLALNEAFGGRADFLVVDNSGGRGDAKVVADPVSFIQNKLDQTPTYEELQSIGRRLGEESTEALGDLAPTFLETSVRPDAGRADGGVNQGVRFQPPGQELSGARLTRRGALSAFEALAPASVEDAPPGWQSTRFPTASKAEENPFTQKLIIGLEALQRSPETLKKQAAAISKYPQFKGADGSRSPSRIVNALRELAEANLTRLHDSMPPEIRERAKRWYDGGRKIVEDFAERYDQSPEATAGVVAALSPQKDWYQNVDLARRVLEENTGLAGSTVTDAQVGWLLPKLSADTPMNKAKREAIQAAAGKRFDDLPMLERAMVLRASDELKGQRSYRIVTPEGEFGDVAERKVAWGDFGTISKALQILADPSYESISRSLGREHKVRNFYNNLLLPNSPLGDVTIDTHAVAAALLSPLAGTSVEVKHNLGAAAGSSLLGISGTYPIYADAYRSAASKLGLLPRELQSITWEAVRGLFSVGFKRGQKDAVAQVWKDYADGKISLPEAQEKVIDSAGGVKPPSWYEN